MFNLEDQLREDGSLLRVFSLMSIQYMFISLKHSHIGGRTFPDLNVSKMDKFWILY